jgi:glycosyltransferase involved in cell wall biosynthesis
MRFMAASSAPRVSVVNFNSPELNQLALALATDGRLTALVRPYLNKQRTWERWLASLPLAGGAYQRTFGRRLALGDTLAALTDEAGVLPDILAAVVGRSPWTSSSARRSLTARLHMQVRDAVALRARRWVERSDCVVGYEGFALPAFEYAKALGTRSAVLNYPVAHHRQRRRVRLEEIAREPGFESTWPDFDDWPAGHEQRLDDEIGLADAILVGSTYAADSFVAEGVDRSKVRVVPYGVDLQTFRPGPASTPKPGFQVIYAGQLTQRKGLAYLLRGYQQFARADSRLTLVGSTVGDPSALAPFAHLFDHVPHQTRPALADRYRAADVFVFPTLIEGMPLVVLEAMACGLPVIVTANGPGDIVRDGVEGFVIPERDEEAVADRLHRLHSDPALRQAMGRAAAQRAKEFSWQAYATKAMAVLTDVSRPRVAASVLPALD